MMSSRSPISPGSNLSEIVPHAKVFELANNRRYIEGTSGHPPDRASITRRKDAQVYCLRDINICSMSVLGS
jgi:hypothetical protein